MQESKPYVMLIDNDEDDLEMLSSLLKRKGLRVLSFNSSMKAIPFLNLLSVKKEQPLLIILDYNMPKTTGLQVLLVLKANRHTKDIPVVMYSTGLSGVLKTQLVEAGALNCFDKPWNSDELNYQVDLFHELISSLSMNHLERG